MDIDALFIQLSSLLLLVTIHSSRGSQCKSLCKQWRWESTTSCFVDVEQESRCRLEFKNVVFNVSDLGYIWAQIEFEERTESNSSSDGGKPERSTISSGKAFWYTDQYTAGRYVMNIHSIDRDTFNHLGLVSATLSFQLNRVSPEDSGVYNITLREGTVFDDNAVILRHTYHLYTEWVHPPSPICISSKYNVSDFLLTCSISDNLFPLEDVRLNIVSSSPENCSIVPIREEPSVVGSIIVNTHYKPCDQNSTILCKLSHERTAPSNLTSFNRRSCAFDLTPIKTPPHHDQLILYVLFPTLLFLSLGLICGSILAILRWRRLQSLKETCTSPNYHSYRTSTLHRMDKTSYSGSVRSSPRDLSAESYDICQVTTLPEHDVKRVSYFEVYEDMNDSVSTNDSQVYRRLDYKQPKQSEM